MPRSLPLRRDNAQRSSQGVFGFELLEGYGGEVLCFVWFKRGERVFEDEAMYVSVYRWRACATGRFGRVFQKRMRCL